MRRAARAVLTVSIVVFIAIQVRQAERTNPPVDPSLAIDRHLPVPADVKAILDRSCRDCHSHETRWPFYAYIAPMSWDLVSHVNHGREEMNLSEWGEYDADAMGDILDAMCRQVRRGNMPLPQYLLIHRSARLSPSDVERLCRWTSDTSVELRARQEAEEEHSTP